MVSSRPTTHDPLPTELSEKRAMTDTRSRAKRDQDEATADLFETAEAQRKDEKADMKASAKAPPKAKKARKGGAGQAADGAGKGNAGGGGKGGGSTSAGDDFIDMGTFAERQLPHLRDERGARARDPERGGRPEAGAAPHPLRDERAGADAAASSIPSRRASSARCSASSIRTATRRPTKRWCAWRRTSRCAIR